MISLDDVITKVEKLHGVDLVYFLDENFQIIKEKNLTGIHNNLEQIVNIIKLESVTNLVGKNLYTKPFHTYTMLNEEGLIVISKIQDTTYMVIIGGLNEPVDLINLLKIVRQKESVI